MAALNAQLEAVEKEIAEHPHDTLMGLAEAVFTVNAATESAVEQINQAAKEMSQAPVQMHKFAKLALDKGVRELREEQDKATATAEAVRVQGAEVKKLAMKVGAGFAVAGLLAGGAFFALGFYKYNELQDGAATLNFGISTNQDENGIFVLLPKGYRLDTRWKCGGTQCGKLLKE